MLLVSAVVLQGALLLVLLPGLLQRHLGLQQELGPVALPALDHSLPLGQREAVPVPAPLVLVLQQTHERTNQHNSHNNTQ